MSKLRDLRVTVMGLGRHGGGLAAARFLARQGARVTISDCAAPDQLAPALAELEDIPLERVALGGHEADHFANAQLVVVNPAVHPSNPWLAELQARGTPLTTEIGLFLEHSPSRVIAVTGSNGKSSTASMLHHLLLASGLRSWLGGNIGGSLLDDVQRMRPGDWVVLELSSFQLARLPAVQRPIDVSLILNCTPNHLDWHGDFASYAQAKQHLLALQDASSLALLGDSTVAPWRVLAPGLLIAPLADSAIPPLAVRGLHQRRNAACAAAIALAIGCPEHALSALASFEGLPHRLSMVVEHGGVQFYDDSKSTTPAATLAALAAIKRPTWLLAGGASKGADFRQLGKAVASYARGAACYGASATQIESALRAADADFPRSTHQSLSQALDWCLDRARPGDAILLSPACASHDQYRDYAQRGADFRQCVERAITCGPRRPSRCDPETGSPPETSSNQYDLPAWHSGSVPSDR